MLFRSAVSALAISELVSVVLNPQLPEEELGDFVQIKDILDDIGALPKAVKLNNGFVDRLVNGKSLDEETREKIKQARCDFSETRNIQVIKPDRHQS